MKNRYLYKAKRKDDNTWITGYLYIDGEQAFILTKSVTHKGHKHTEVLPETICQCIGNVDADNKLIFEHDLVKYPDHFGDDGIYEILWLSELMFAVYNNGAGYVDAEFGTDITSDDLIVVGNIYDNPQLVDNPVDKN